MLLFFLGFNIHAWITIVTVVALFGQHCVSFNSSAIII